MSAVTFADANGPAGHGWYVKGFYAQGTTPSTFLEEWKDNQYRVGWVNSWASRNEKPLETQIRIFQSFPEAAADDVLFSWGYPRLTKEQAIWYEMDYF